MKTAPLEQLTLSHKRTVVGNLLRGTSPGLGFGLIKWMERLQRADDDWRLAPLDIGLEW